MRVCVLFLFLLSGFIESAQAYTTTQLLENRLDPLVNYKTIRTEHFFIHFPESLSSLARDVAITSEKVYARVTKALLIPYVDPTHIVIVDHSDEPAVFTMVYPQRQIFFDASLPQMAKGINDYGDYTDWVLTHEFTHIAELEMRRGVYSFLSPVFGSWIRPHLTVPVWEKEGLAVLLESKLTPIGRGTGSEYPMMMRMAVKEGLLGDSEFVRKDTIFTLDNKAWPWGNRPYLFGYSLMSTIEKKDRNLIPRLLRDQAGAFPYRIGAALESIGYSGFDELWESTLQGIRERANQELKKIQKVPLTSLEYLTNQGNYFHGLQVSPDGKKLYVNRDHPDFENAILGFNLRGDQWEGPKEVTFRSTGYQLSVSKSSRFLAFDQTLRSKRHYELSDIYIYDLKKNEIFGGSQNLRARDPDIHPDGNHLVYVMNENGKNRLIYNDVLWRKPIDVLGDVGYSRLSGPRFSTDGKKIVLSVHNAKNGAEDLWLVDLEKNRTFILVENGAQNTGASWVPGSDRILFSSNFTGVSNIYALDLSTKKIQALTNIEGGLFYPVIDPSGRWIYVVSYRGMGYDVARFRAPVFKKIKSSVVASYPEHREVPEVVRTSLPNEARSYRGVDHLFPQYLMPSLLFRPGDSQFGLSTGAIDPLFFQNYTVNLRYDGKFKKPVGSVYYFNGTQAFATDLTLIRDVTSVAGTDFPYQSFTTEFGIHIPLSSYGNHVYLHPYLIYQSSRVDASSRSFGFGSEFRYDTTFKQIGHSFPEAGFRFTVDDRQLYSMLGDRKQPNALSLSLGSHHALPWTRHALHFTLEGAGYLKGGSESDYFYTVGGTPSFPYASDNVYTFYGARNEALRATRLGLGTALYTFSLVDIERGLGTTPIYFGRLSGGIRAQGAKLPDGVLPTSGFPWSIGAELYQSFVFGTLFDVTARIGVYRASRSLGGETQALFFLSTE